MCRKAISYQFPVTMNRKDCQSLLPWLEFHFRRPSFVASTRRWCVATAAAIAAIAVKATAGLGAENAVTRFKAGQPVSLPAALWMTAVEAGDSVSVSQVEDCVKIDFDLGVQRKLLIADYQQDFMSFRLLLSEPIMLSERQTRILFEASLVPENAPAWLRPLIRDARGEWFVYRVSPGTDVTVVPRNPQTHWARMTTPYFFCFEAGGEGHGGEVAEAQGGDHNVWPDGPLEFMGFEYRGGIPPNKGRHKGAFYLGLIQAGGLKLPYEHHAVYADSLVKASGTYTLSAQIANDFQANPIREFQVPFTFDAGSPASRRRRIFFPCGPDGVYWVRYQVADTNGNIVIDESERCQVLGNADPDLPRPIDTRTPPVIGQMRINPDRNTCGVYPRDQPLDVVVRVFPKVPGQPRLSWRLTPYRSPEALEEGSTTVEFSGESFKDLAISLKWQPDRDAYRLQLDLKLDKTFLDRQVYVLGRKTDFLRTPSIRDGPLARDREHLKRSPHLFLMTSTFAHSVQLESDRLRAFGMAMERAADLTANVVYTLDPANLEILPGVYDFAELDRSLDAAADRGCAVTINFSHFTPAFGDDLVPFRWLHYFTHRNFDNALSRDHHYSGFNPLDEQYRAFWKRAHRALFERYRGHPGFQGYYLTKPTSAVHRENLMMDRPYLGEVTGYDPGTRKEFIAWLRNVLGLTIEQLNRRWESRYATWDQIEVPLPDFELGKQPDLRMVWTDFCRFKTYANEYFWFKNLAADIRSYDTNRIIMVWGEPQYSPEETILRTRDEAFLQQIDYVAHAVIPQSPAPAFEPLLRKHRIGIVWNLERFADDRRPWLLDVGLYHMLRAYGANGLHLCVPGLLGTDGRDLRRNSGYDRWEKFKPICLELQAMKLVSAPAGRPAVAALQDPTTLYCKHRHSFLVHMEDTGKWFQLMNRAGLDYEPLDPTRTAEYKLVLPNLLDEVMSRATIEWLDAYVRGGGRTIISANTGRYCPEADSQAYVLLRKFGISPPAGEFVQEGDSIQAAVTEDNPFFAKGERVKFFMPANLRQYNAARTNAAEHCVGPYAYMQETGYFGYYRDNTQACGRALARFDAGGGVALSQHAVGKGEVLVFWGIPDYHPLLLKDLMPRACAWACVSKTKEENPVPGMLVGVNEELGRWYAVLCEDKPGTYAGQKIAAMPDGEWVAEELVSDEQLGAFTGRNLRENGLTLDFRNGASPLKVIRFLPAK